jgi:hypothetical protein
VGRNPRQDLMHFFCNGLVMVPLDAPSWSFRKIRVSKIGRVRLCAGNIIGGGGSRKTPSWRIGIPPPKHLSSAWWSFHRGLPQGATKSGVCSERISWGLPR